MMKEIVFTPVIMNHLTPGATNNVPTDEYKNTSSTSSRTSWEIFSLSCNVQACWLAVSRQWSSDQTTHQKYDTSKMMIHDIWLFCFFLLHHGSLSKIVPTTEETLIIEEPLTGAGFTFVNENDTPKDLTEDVKTSEQVYIFYSTVFSNGSNPVITTNISDSKIVRNLSNRG